MRGKEMEKNRNNLKASALPSAMGLPPNSFFISQERNVIERITTTQRESEKSFPAYLSLAKT